MLHYYNAFIDMVNNKFVLFRPYQLTMHPPKNASLFVRERHKNISASGRMCSNPSFQAVGNNCRTKQKNVTAENHRDFSLWSLKFYLFVRNFYAIASHANFVAFS